MEEKVKCFFVNSFAERELLGNSAAVAVVDNWPTDDCMQRIALRNNLSETAFCCCIDDNPSEPTFEIRWFTPGCEVPLCGHATLATAFILFTHFFKEATLLKFKSKSGELSVTRDDNDVIRMDFPLYLTEKVLDKEEINAVTQAVGKERGEKIVEIRRGIDYVIVFKEESDVTSFIPDFERIKQLPKDYNLLITAPSNKEKKLNSSLSMEYDFVSRCFFPKEAIDEDPVTGSAHCTLAPLWAEKLNKRELTAYQCSQRGGILHLKVLQDRVLIGGHAKKQDPQR